MPFCTWSVSYSDIPQQTWPQANHCGERSTSRMFRGGWRLNHGYPIKVITWWLMPGCNGRPTWSYCRYYWTYWHSLFCSPYRDSSSNFSHYLVKGRCRFSAFNFWCRFKLVIWIFLDFLHILLDMRLFWGHFCLGITYLDKQGFAWVVFYYANGVTISLFSS